MQNLMLYYHVPFCVSKCAYCAFHSIPNAGEELKERYTDALIRQTKGFFDSEKYTVSSVYFGGGTPTVLGAERLSRIFKAVNERFSLLANTEITVEINPCTINKQGLSLLKSSGFNRLSIGAQSFNAQTLKLLNRAHTAEDFFLCYNDARSVGFDNISADLIFALPNENTSLLTNSIKTLVELSPEHISVYGLSLEEGTSLYNNKRLYTFPDEDAEEEQYEIICSRLAEAGYLHYEISNFSKPGFESRHNSGYWKRTAYFGFGSGAHSFFNNKRFETKKDICAFIENSHGSFTDPTNYDFVPTLSAEEAETERIMLGLRLSEGIKIKKPVPKYLLDTDLVKYKDEYVCLTERGFRLSNSIIALLI